MPLTLLPKFALVNDEANGDPHVPVNDLARMLGGNYARFVGLEWSLDETVQQMQELDERWRAIWDNHEPPA
jgi:hypothetical protein